MARTSNVFARVQPEVKELDYSTLTKEQFDAEIQKGITDIENGRVYSVDEVEEEMHRLYGV